MKEIKKWEVLTFILLLLSILGAIITYFLETYYAKRFNYWVKNNFTPITKKTLKKVVKIIEDLPEDKQQQLLLMATKGATKATNEALDKLHSNLNIKYDDVKKIIQVGAKKVAKIIKDKK